MRLTIFALLVSTGTAAICQSPAPAPGNPQRLWLASPGLPEGGRDFTKLPLDWHITSLAPRKMLVLPGPVSHLENPQIDAQVILHPPPSSLGEQPTTMLLAQNLYPSLQLMPIDDAKAKGEPIPTTWPNLKVKQIPIVWSKFEVNPVQSGAKVPAAEK